MPIEILMPALSPTMEEGNLAKWLKNEGDKVASGDVIAEIETDKATMEVEAVDEGKIGKILVAEGSEGVKVNAVIAVLLLANGCFLSFGVSPFLLKREREGRSAELLPAVWQAKIAVSLIVSDLGWWSALFLFSYRLAAHS